ncbi:hypothetical protein ACFJGW_19875 [Burkholderiaceae bacterium UC74_6]
MSSTSRTAPEAVALGRHLQQCHRARGRWFGAAMLAEELHRLAAPRFATTILLFAVVTAASCTWL